MSGYRNYLRLTVMLRERRKALKMTQQDVAHRVGASLRTLVRWEAGETVPDAMQLFHWADMVGVEITPILTQSGKAAS